jgi:hypothetical protein
MLSYIKNSNFQLNNMQPRSRSVISIFPFTRKCSIIKRKELFQHSNANNINRKAASGDNYTYLQFSIGRR